MKKLLTIAAALGMACFSYGQGYVNFGNTSGTRISTNSFFPAPGAGLTAAVAGSYYFALFVAPSTTQTVGAPVFGDPIRSGWTFTGDYATNEAVLGRFLGYGPLDTSSVQIPGFPAGSTADFMVVGWSADIGTTWAAAELSLDGGSYSGLYSAIGESIVGQTILAPAGGPYNQVMGSPTIGLIGGFILNDILIPEPTTFALAGLGAAALVIFRRRK